MVSDGTAFNRIQLSNSGPTGSDALEVFNSMEKTVCLSEARALPMSVVLSKSQLKSVQVILTRTSFNTMVDRKEILDANAEQLVQ